MGLGVDLTLLLAPLHLTVFAWALRGARADGAAVAAAEETRPVDLVFGTLRLDSTVDSALAALRGPGPKRGRGAKRLG
jgi:hypothetical protein